MTVSPSRFDDDMMSIALRMAHCGLGITAPNPAVGAVIADENTGEVIARGWTAPGGRPHAETEAIRRAGRGAQGATIYVTLEPCAHFGKTPPCADAIVAAGLKRAVVGVGDPDPRTAGQGIARLRAAGLTVATGVREAEARWLTLGHIFRITAHRPFVTLKMATDATGAIARGDGQGPRWVTGPEARAAGHLLRAQADAILIGAGTLRDDNPDLTCRLPGLESQSPLRAILAGRQIFDPRAYRIFEPQPRVPVVLLHAGSRSAMDQQLEQAGIATAMVDAGADGQPDICSVLGTLADRGITRLLVEGGPSLWRAFDDAGTADEVVMFTAGQGMTKTDAGMVLARFLARGLFELAEVRPAGGDTLWRWRRAPAKRPAGIIASPEAQP